MVQLVNRPGTSFGKVGDEDAIAIIGMATRLPQEADTNGKLWELLLEARNTTTPFPSERVNHEAHYHPDHEHAATFFTKGGHFLKDDPANFDLQFFSLTKSEALTMDPQQRILMENVYHALENSGVPLKRAMSSMTSVFVSGFNHDFLQLLNHDSQATAKYKPTGMTNSILANRISWFYDFKAPSMTVDTACSSSMVALHLGCQSLKAGECGMSVVSGVNALYWPVDFMAMSHHGFLSPDGKCYSFDHRANGYSRAEGVGTVILKKLSDAIRDGNSIRAVIRGTGVNQDGRTPGITLPNGAAQEALIHDVYSRANLDPEDTVYFESHGTGTTAGDPIEARAISTAFKTSLRDSAFYVGAMKPAVGHLEGASGIASIIKSIMILESGIIPPNANFERVNPKIPADRWKLKFPTRATPWPTEGYRRISVNGAGFGGTNAHAILDDAYSYLKTRSLKGIHKSTPTVPTEADIERRLLQIRSTRPVDEALAVLNKQDRGEEYAESGAADKTLHGDIINEAIYSNGELQKLYPMLFPLSAFDEAGVSRNAKSLAAYLKNLPSMDSNEESKFMADLAYTLCTSRSDFGWRDNCIASSRSELANCLESEPRKPFRTGKSNSLGFVFTGQGAQWYAMGRELFTYPVFKRSIEAADQYIKGLGSSWSLLEELYRDKDSTNISRPAIAHVASAALQIAIVELLHSWRVRPTRVVGHSSGEIAAAYCAGKIGRKAAWRIAYFRGIVSSIKTPVASTMMAVGASQHDIAPYLTKAKKQFAGILIIACYNSPKNVTVSGDECLIDALKELLDADSIFARKLTVPVAYHSSHMEAVGCAYLSLLGNIKSDDRLESQDNVFMISSVTGQAVDSDVLESGQYWYDNLVSPVNFVESLAAACFRHIEKGEKYQKSVSLNNAAEHSFLHDLVEIGPHGALKSAIKQTIDAQYNVASSIGYLSVLDRNNPGIETVLKVPALLKSKGYDIDLMAANVNARHFSPQMLVDLPPYKFDHTTKLWFESRITKNFRLRQHPIHDLFGAPVADWSNEEPKWRHVMRLSENPWLKEHIMTGSYIFPGVGYAIMAIEAAKQMSDPKLALSGFRLRDVSIKAALNIADSRDGVEVMISMSRMEESSTERSRVWSSFRIASWNPTDNDWIEHCIGHISVEPKLKANFVGEDFEAQQEEVSLLHKLTEATRSCTFPLDLPEFYDNMHDNGLEFGPLFRNLTDVRLSSGLGEAMGVVTVPDVAESMPKKFIRPHVIHPCTLDSMLHLSMMSILDHLGIATLPVAMLPTFIKEIWVSSDISSTVGHVFQGHGKSKSIAAQRYETDITIWDSNTRKPRVIFKGMKATPVSNASSNDLRASKLCHTIEWRPDLDLYRSHQTSSSVCATQGETDFRLQEVQDLQLATMLLIMDALESLEGVKASYEAHLGKYHQWLVRQAEIFRSDGLIHLPFAKWLEHRSDEEFKQQLYNKVASRSAEGELAIRAGSNIVAVLRNEVDPLALLFSDDLLDRVYANAVEAGNITPLIQSYLDVVGHNHTDLNILEIGAGTGSLTSVFLETLNPIESDERNASKGSKIAKYDFTDISPAFFKKAAEKFQHWADILHLLPLNIEKDPEAQGFDAGSYDIIVAGNVLHATSTLGNTLKNVRRLLKPGGKLIIHEGVREDFLFVPVAFGFLSGWWLSAEESRKWCPFINEKAWTGFLRDSGFTNIEHSLKDWPNEDLNGTSVLIASTEVDQGQESALPNRAIVVTADGDRQEQFAAAIATELVDELKCSDCTIAKYSDILSLDFSDTICICLAELEGSVLYDPTEHEFKNIQHLLVRCKKVLWVTGDPIEDPKLNITTGLIRASRWERDLEDPNFVLLGISSPRPPHSDILQTVFDIIDLQFVKAYESKINAEYLLKDGVVLTNRLVNAAGMNDYLTAKNSRGTAQLVPLGEAQANRPLRLTTEAPGMLNKLAFETDPVYFEPLGEHDVEIKVKAVGLNFRDVMIAMGEHNSLNFGSEGSGVVTRIGTGVSRVKVGDHVVYVDGHARTGTFQTYGRAEENCFVTIPKDISLEVAASLPTIYLTSYYALFEVARLSKGETVLIHSGAGGVGQAAIMLANHVGAEVFTTVSTAEKAELLIDRYGVQRDHIFYSRDLSFAQGIMRMTNGRGVDVILNSLAGEFLRRTWDCIAPFGRFIEIGKKDAQNNGRVSLGPLLRNVIMASVDLITIIRCRPVQSHRLFNETIQLFLKGEVKEVYPLNVASYSQLEERFRMLQSGKGMGKTVLVPHDDAMVRVAPQPQAVSRLSEDASYVVSGGFGGIGRRTALWMSSHGAKHIIILSRSGAGSPIAQKTIKDLQERGTNVYAFACDVSNESRLSAVLQECQATLPPIRGCVQLAMVISDKMFENMSLEEFQTATRPKVQGSWNLHSHLPREMDFFIMFSSVNGVIGNRGQANYAAGNTFQDALAEHRVALGLPSTSLDLGALLSVGYVADNRDRLTSGQTVAGLLDSVREDEIHSMLEYHFDPTHYQKRPIQITSGISTAQDYMSRGMPSPTWMYRPFFKHLSTTNFANSSGLKGGQSSDDLSIAGFLTSATSAEDVIGVIAEQIRTKLSKLLTIPAENIDLGKSVSNNGVDSLVAVEFRVWLAKAVGAEVPLLDIMGSIPIGGPAGLSAKAAAASSLVPGSLKPGGGTGSSPS